MSALGSQKVTRLSLSLGLTGSWRAEVWCEQGEAPTGKVDLVVADLTFKGVAVRGGTDAPDAPHVVHVGAPGWDTIVSASDLAWQIDGGVRLSTVLRDLATRAGETVEQPVDVSLGRHWCVVAARPSDPLRLRDALAALVAGRYVEPWRVDLDGVTRFGARSGGVVDVSAVTVIGRDAGAGYAILGADTFANVLPGSTFEDATIDRLVITERPGNLQAEVWSRAPSAMTSILRKVAQTFPQLVYGYPRTYRVGAVFEDGRLDLDPPSDAPHLPALQRVEVWGLGGARVKPAIGSLVVVMFRDANPARPTVVALEPLTGSGASASKPELIEIDADAIYLASGSDTIEPAVGAENGRVVRYGDTVSVGPSIGPPSVIGLVRASGIAPAVSKVRA